MADYCKQCSTDLFGKDYKNFAGLVPPGGRLVDVLCEGCGPTTVDPTGKCVGSCERHNPETPSKGCLLSLIFMLMVFASIYYFLGRSLT